jgi:hypothetical protein
MSISWGRRTRIRFEAAGEFTKCNPPAGMPAVFALTYKQDAANKPKSHTVLYFGESADLAKDLHAQCTDIKEKWLNTGGRETELYVFYHPMPASTLWQRASVQSQLVSEYDPPQNTDN